MEWLWSEWCAQAHYRDQLHFEDLQMIGLRSLIRNGEMLHLPVMDERPGCRFALRIQDIRPIRLRTPWDRQYDPCIHDGVEVSDTGIPQAYWIASPPPSVAMLDDVMYTSACFLRVPARVGHRKGIFHIFRPESEEQYRGVSSLATALKFFRHLNDSIDYELFAQVIAASFPVFIGLENGTQYLPYNVQEDEENQEEKMIIDSDGTETTFLAGSVLGRDESGKLGLWTANSADVSGILAGDVTVPESGGASVDVYVHANVVADALIFADGVSTDLVLGKNAWTAFRRHPDVKDTLDNRRIEIGNLSPRVQAKFKGIWNGLNIWTHNATYKDIKEQTRYYLEPDCALLLEHFSLETVHIHSF